MMGTESDQVKRRIKKCDKMHSDSSKAELEAHPDREMYTAEYETGLMLNTVRTVRVRCSVFRPPERLFGYLVPGI